MKHWCAWAALMAAPHLLGAGACSAPAYRQFDFWAGDWDAFENGAPVARLRVDKILDSCVLREDYRGADGSSGQSFNMYDAAAKRWRQNWVNNRGLWLELEGVFRNGEMVLAGVEHAAGGAEKL